MDSLPTNQTFSLFLSRVKNLFFRLFPFCTFVDFFWRQCKTWETVDETMHGERSVCCWRHRMFERCEDAPETKKRPHKNKKKIEPQIYAARVRGDCCRCERVFSSPSKGGVRLKKNPLMFRSRFSLVESSFFFSKKGKTNTEFYFFNF